MDNLKASAYLAPTLCQHCGGSCETQRITLTLRRSQHGFAVMRNVPSDVCENCGEAQFTLGTTGQLMTTLQANRPPDEIALIPIYDLSAA